jgi:phosphotransferase family enzyme
MTSSSPSARAGELSRPIDPEVVRILQRSVPGAQILRTAPLGADAESRPEQATAKAAGYGIPIRIDALVDGQRRSFVLHGTSSNQFGHDRRSDRAAELLLAADTFSAIPRHVQALDVGALRADGSSVSLTDTREFYLLTDYLEGRPYAEDLRRIANRGAAEPADVRRVRSLVDYLAILHVRQEERGKIYERSMRDLLGSGEGIFGIVDAYPASTPGADSKRLKQIEAKCQDLRWRLKQRPERLARIHGDFHPFNVLFDEQAGLQVLDTSRGSLGDPADDVTCMAVNFIFFAIEDGAAWQGAFSFLWREFWSEYLSRTKDEELLLVAGPFLAWRLLVLACPVWYPNLSSRARERLLSFIDLALEQDRFDPRSADQVFR